MNNNLVGDEVGKLFVGGLDWSTTQETLRNYFSQYGEVVDCVIMKDKTTNQSRGFGFVKFKDPNCVRTVLETKPHNLDGRNIDPKPCTPRGMQPEKSRTKEGWKGSKADSNKSKKIFVGGIPHNCGEPELRDYFNRFGVVTEVVMIYDAEKQRPRGFGFITFEAEQSVDQAVNMHFHDIMGKKVEVKKAEPRDSKAPGQLGPGQWAPRGILSAANGWTTQPAQGWQQPYGPQGVWVSTTGQPIDLFCVGAGGYGPPLSAGRGTPTQPPSPFNAFLVTTPAGGFAAPQGYPQQGYSTAPQFGYSFGTPQADQYAPQVPPPPTTPGTAPLGFAPATTPTQDLSKAPTGQPDFPYSQYGLGNYPQDPSAYGPTRPSHSYGQDEQGGYSAAKGVREERRFKGGHDASTCPIRLWVRAGPGSLRSQLRRPQPANGLVRGPDSTAHRCPPTSRQCVRQRAEPQRTGLPPVSTLSATSGQGCCVKFKNKNKKRSQGNV